MSNLNVCLDLGNSSLKIGFGVKIGNEIHYGKITEEAPLPPSYFASGAFFDEESGTWVFGSAIEKRRSNSFSTIVKIKDLLSLLQPVSDAKTSAANRDYYYKGNQFPKFLFPPIPEIKSNGRDLGYLIKKGYGFESPVTPQRLCEDYFAYVAALVADGLRRIADKFGMKREDLFDYTVSLIYPNGAAKEYIGEYKRLIEGAFGKKIDHAVSSTRALAYYAKSQGKVKGGDEFLVFDVGDESVSVSKAALHGGNLLIDGIDGHSAPLGIGGNDIDERIVRLIESKISQRETMGTPSYGEDGHITESGLAEKNYLLTRDVKAAKVLLSSDDENLRAFKAAPIDVNREVFFRTELTRKELNECSGVLDATGKHGVAGKLADYIVREMDQVINRHVNKILIAGGVIETEGLFDYLRTAVCRKCSNLKPSAFLTFERKENESDPLGISETEDSSYAAALGGCYLSVEKIPVKICLPLTFASNFGSPTRQYAALFAGKGTPLKPGQINEFSIPGTIGADWKEEIYSFQVTRDEIEKREIEGPPKYSPDGLLVYDAEDKSVRRLAEKYAGLKVLLTNKILLKHRGRVISAFEPGSNKKFSFVEGIRVDEDGHAEVFLKPGEMTFSTARVQFASGVFEMVFVKDIQILWENARTTGFETNTGN